MIAQIYKMMMIKDLQESRASKSGFTIFLYTLNRRFNSGAIVQITRNSSRDSDHLSQNHGNRVTEV